jgi:hypothetical protein
MPLVDALIRLVVGLFLMFLLLPLLDRRVRGRYNRQRFVQVVVVSVALLAFLVWWEQR